MNQFKNNHLQKKIIKYNIATYLLLLGIETINNIFSILLSAKTGKVFSSLYNDGSTIFKIIWIDLVQYISALIFIYVVFAWMNDKIIQKISLKLSNRLKGISYDYLIVAVFFIVNITFVLISYIFVSILYPQSRQDLISFAHPPQGQIVYFMFYLFAFMFFLSVYYSLKESSKTVRYGFMIVLFCAVFFNFLPQIISFTHTSVLPTGTEIQGNKGPNVIILGIDSLRPDHLVRNGFTESIVPNTEKILEKTIIFTNAYTPLARTFPSWMSILTGKYPSETGIRYNLIQRHYYPNDHPTISKLLQKEYGYYSMHAMDETRFCNLIFDDGFDEFMHPVTGVVDFLFGKLHDYSISNLFFNNRTGNILFPFIKNNRAISRLYDGKQFVTDIENKFASLKNKDRFFFAIHLCAAHWPYRLRGIKNSTLKHYIEPSEQYKNALKMADNQLGLIMDAIKRNGFYDNSIIIVLSDHGEAFEPYWGHGTSLYDGNQNHIVLGIKPVDFTGHHEDSRLVSTVNIAPTIADLLNIDKKTVFPKKSLFADNNPASEDDTRVLFMETGFHLFHSFGKGFTIGEMINEGAKYYTVSPETKKVIVKDEYHEKIIDTKQIAVLTDKWKLIAQKNNYNKWKIDLFDFNDKTSIFNLNNQYPEVIEELLPLLNGHFKVDIEL